MNDNAKRIVRNSMAEFKAADDAKRKVWLSHIQSLLKAHEKGLESIGMGYEVDMVTAGRVFLRIYREKYSDAEGIEGVGSNSRRPV